MNAFLCQVDGLASTLIWVYTIMLFAYAVISWIPDLRGPWVRYLAMAIEPVLQPIRRIIPPVGGLDLAFLVLLVLLQFVIRPLLQHLSFNACYGV